MDVDKAGVGHLLGVPAAAIELVAGAIAGFEHVMGPFLHGAVFGKGIVVAHDGVAEVLHFDPAAGFHVSGMMEWIKLVSYRRMGDFRTHV